ncbi:MAG: molybdate ABC transporter permease subunit [Chloroflexi bacterium]|nr:MAG: molybdate ABC transporter permease subunit [Chloroflexota bacterium]
MQDDTVAVKSEAKLSQRFDRAFLPLLGMPLILFIVLPLVALLTQVPYQDIFKSVQDLQVRQAIQLSLFTSTISVLVTVVFGTPVAYLLARSRSRSVHLIDTIVDLPTILPPAVAGVALLIAFGRRGVFGAWLSAIGISLPFTQAAVIMAQIFVASPFFVKAAAIGFSGIRTELLEAAALDGASRWQTFWHVTLPLARLSILTGSVMTWARALGEFGATIIFAGNFPGRTQTMPLAIYVGFEIDLSTALLLSFILICFSFLTLAAVKLVLNRTSERAERGEI